MIGKELLMIGINDREGIAYDRRKSRVSVSNLKKAGKVMTADHRDLELWERYFKPCKMQFSLRKSIIKITSLTLTWKVDDSMDKTTVNTLPNTFHRFFINPIVYC
jgi:hypothetical protein